jgi:hypothetical protein
MRLGVLRGEHGFDDVGWDNNSPSESHTRHVTVFDVFVEGGLADAHDDGRFGNCERSALDRLSGSDHCRFHVASAFVTSRRTAWVLLNWIGRMEMTSPVFGATIMWVALMAMPTWPRSWMGIDPRRKMRSPGMTGCVCQLMLMP